MSLWVSLVLEWVVQLVAPLLPAGSLLYSQLVVN